MYIVTCSCHDLAEKYSLKCEQKVIWHDMIQDIVRMTQKSVGCVYYLLINENWSVYVRSNHMSAYSLFVYVKIQ